MPRIEIDSAADERLGVYRQLPQRKASREAPQFVVEGRWLVQRLLNSEMEIESILCGKQQADEFEAIRENIPLYVADGSIIDDLVGFEFHRGVMACGLRPRSPDLIDVARIVRSPALLAACAGVCDQENLGSVIRNCQAFGVRALLLDSACADPFSRRVTRVSAGAAFQLPIVESTDLKHDLATLSSEHQFKIVATVIGGDVRLDDSSVDEKMVIVLGNEGYGLDKSIRSACHEQVTLPMQGGVDSLNVGVASGIFLHHYSLRQRSQFAD